MLLQEKLQASAEKAWRERQSRKEQRILAELSERYEINLSKICLNLAIWDPDVIKEDEDVARFMHLCRLLAGILAGEQEGTAEDMAEIRKSWPQVRAAVCGEEIKIFGEE